MITDQITVTVSDGALRGRPVWAVSCDDCGLVGTRVQRDRAEALADEHLTRHGVE